MLKYKLLWICLIFIVFSCEASKEKQETISIPIYEIRTSSFPFTEDDETFFVGPIKRITIKGVSIASSGFRERLRIIDFDENGNILSSKVLVDDIESEVQYLYNDLNQVINILYFENQSQIETHEYTYENINESDIYVSAYSQKEDKNIYSERISYDFENSIIISKVKDISTEVIFKYIFEDNRIVTVEQNSMFFNLRRKMKYSEEGRIIRQFSYRRGDILYQIENFKYNDNGNLISIVVEDSIKEQVISRKEFSNFDDYGNWQNLEVIKDENTILASERIFEYY